MTKKILIFPLIISFLLLPLSPSLATSAAPPSFDYDINSGLTNVLQSGTGLGTQSPTTMVMYAINFGLSILGLFFLALMLWGGFTWMNARGRDDEVTKAKDMIISAVIGLVIILASYSISNYIYDKVRDVSTTYFQLISPAYAVYEPQNLAFEIGTNDISNKTKLGTQNPEATAGYLINVGLSVLGIFFLALTLYAGFIWMNARGRDDEVTKAKDMIIAAVIGLVIILVSYGATTYIIDTLYNITLIP